jgi:hypothetical protein
MKHKRHEKTKKAICGPTQGNWQQMNRKQRREMTRKIQSEDISLEVIHPDAAGIDIGCCWQGRPLFPYHSDLLPNN